MLCTLKLYFCFVKTKGPEIYSLSMLQRGILPQILSSVGQNVASTCNTKPLQPTVGVCLTNTLWTTYFTPGLDKNDLLSPGQSRTELTGSQGTIDGILNLVLVSLGIFESLEMFIYKQLKSYISFNIKLIDNLDQK